MKWVFLNSGPWFSPVALKTPACSRLCFEAECAPPVTHTASKEMHVASHLVHSNLQQGFSHLDLKHLRHSEYTKEEYIHIPEDHSATPFAECWQLPWYCMEHQEGLLLNAHGLPEGTSG